MQTYKHTSFGSHRIHARSLRQSHSVRSNTRDRRAERDRERVRKKKHPNTIFLARYCNLMACNMKNFTLYKNRSIFLARSLALYLSPHLTCLIGACICVTVCVRESYSVVESEKGETEKRHTHVSCRAKACITKVRDRLSQVNRSKTHTQNIQSKRK